ncbi:TOX high mobility group box family member 3 isoform X3 [Plutella xylostella]|uniref:TOX high mobility group box family member 3 isoform X3 n=1 Tax=Plutella xylostella TaxID=51655 RepID=UPI002032DCA6|nr:TOX high mobility group box family member 3 isoform X3 [Plutella xylostella]
MEGPQALADRAGPYKAYETYKRPESFEPLLSAARDSKISVYAMNDQTFHTPSFGDEEFDIPSIHGQHGTNGHAQYAQMHAAPQVGMMNPAQDGLSPPGGAPSYQQPLYLQEPHTPVTSHSGAGAPAGNYIIQQQPGGQQRLLMMQPSQVMSGPPTPNTPTQAAPQTAPTYGSPQRASPPGTTSDDSDDSVPSHHSQLPGDAESLLPIHYCSASRQQQTTLHQQVGVGNMTLKRSSPEPMDNGINRGQMQKKPKVQKKKKKRDPNEPQKPVSAYALFFRDTQAAIKGQNPNASFGEVSKIVASMWDGLDSEHKSVYKQKTEVAKKEYLKALAAYRASLVSKGGDQENPAMFNHNNTANPNYGNYYQGQNYGNGHSPQGYAPNQTPQGYSPQNYPGSQGTPAYGGQGHPGQPQQGYPANPQQSPQNYQGGQMTHSPQTYQAVPGQSPQNYQGNPATSPPSCQSNVAQSPRNYQNAQSPPNYGGSGLPSPSYRQMQSQSPPMGAVHAMQYHQAQQQMQQSHQQQVHQYQQQQHHQQQMQQQQQQQQQQQASQQQMQQQTQQAPQQMQQAPQQQPSPKQENSLEQHSPNSNGNPGMPQQSPDQNENRSPTSCIRQGCTNPAVANSEWEDEYCSNECVVSHCRDVFSSWVASNGNQIQNFSAVK